MKIKEKFLAKVFISWDIEWLKTFASYNGFSYIHNVNERKKEK